MFSNINADKDELIQLVLVGQPELRDRIAQPRLVQFAQRVAAEYHLPAMSAEAVRRLHRPPAGDRRREPRDLHAGRLRMRAPRLARRAAAGQPDLRLCARLCLHRRARQGRRRGDRAGGHRPAHARQPEDGGLTADGSANGIAMGNLDLKFYWAVFLRRLPYFLVIVAFLTAVGVTVAMILPPVYTSSASMLVEPQQIPGDLAQTTVTGRPLRAGADHRAAADDAGEPARARQADRHVRRHRAADDLERHGRRHPPAHHLHRLRPGRDPRRPNTPGATIIGVSFEAPTGEFANKGANELVNLVLEENVRLRTGPGQRHAASSSSPRSTACRASSSGRAPRSPSSRPRTSRRCPTASRSGATARSSSRSG